MEFKVVVLGDGGVGKSTFVIQFVSGHFIEEYDPTLEDSYRKQLTFEDETYLLDIIDTYGQEEFIAIRDQYYRYGQVFLFLYSITNRRSFEFIQTEYKRV